jgi:hypothetical protein
LLQISPFDTLQRFRENSNINVLLPYLESLPFFLAKVTLSISSGSRWVKVKSILICAEIFSLSFYLNPVLTDATKPFLQSSFEVQGRSEGSKEGHTASKIAEGVEERLFVHLTLLWACAKPLRIVASCRGSPSHLL